jgi:phosphatidylglycerophosphate synthase
MNPIALTHIFSGIVTVAVSWPLIKRKVRMNSFYGFRIKAAFESEQNWYDINAYGGRLLFGLGILIIITGLLGILLPLKLWLTYALISLVVIIVGLVISLVKTLRYAAQLKRHQ